MIRSPIKWAGGKTRVMPQLLEHLPKADCLIEPFVGSGTVFMNTDYRRYVLCDSNRALINFFLQLRDDTERLIAVARDVFKHGNSKSWYYGERDQFNTLSWDDSERDCYATLWAASFLYLNRHCYNGLYRTNKKGGFNVPFGSFKAPYFPEVEMRMFAEKARDTHAIFLCNDFRTSIPYIAKNSTDSVIYCDPPYIPTSKTANFTAYGKPFTLDDHRALVSILLDVNRQHGTRSVISNSDTPETSEIYSAFNLHAFSVRRSVSAKSRDMAGEVIGVLPEPEQVPVRMILDTGKTTSTECPWPATTWIGFDPAAGFDNGEPC